VRLVFGLTGPNAAGKGEVAHWFRERGFAVHSLSDVVREEAAVHGLPPEREILIRTGNELRERHGPGVLAERIVPRLGDRDVVDSIRNPYEVEALRRVPGFVLLGITAREEVRFRRSVSRARPGDPETLEMFRRREREENTDDPGAQRLDATFRLADRVVRNDGDLAALHAELEQLLYSY
jgi:dephospho-CoA kinase